ncbi:MAG: B12-binding domain-containing radical SAM protein [Planctomycetota bacterium]
MLVLVNTNRMRPAVAPIGLDYIASAAERAGIPVEVADLCLEDDPRAALAQGLARRAPRAVGVTFRNVDDCFWPGRASFVDELSETVREIRALTDAPIVVGGVGFSTMPLEIYERSGADFGIHGDGERALLDLLAELEGPRRFGRIPGLLWRSGGAVRRNPPSWEDPILLESRRDAVRNRDYFALGGQGAVETKRGCPGRCIYCADPLAKGPRSRLRPPRAVADEIEALLSQGVDVLHLADSEFNLPPEHARAVCEELCRRRLGGRIRWYAYLAVAPFGEELATLLARAGCAGINFGADSASDRILEGYRRPYRRADIADAIRTARAHGIAVMIDLLLGGPGETPETVRETIAFLKAADPDCVGAALGVRVYPGTELARRFFGAGPSARAEGIRGAGGLPGTEGAPLDLVRPTFYVSPALGERPAALVRDAIGGDRRFFLPPDEAAAGAPGADSSSHNYAANARLEEAIRRGARGAYWDILRRLG